MLLVQHEFDVESPLVPGGRGRFPSETKAPPEVVERVDRLIDLYEAITVVEDAAKTKLAVPDDVLVQDANYALWAAALLRDGKGKRTTWP